MLATPHLLVGAVIGSLFSSWPPVIIIAFLSHYILDAIPHTESSTFRPIEERRDPKFVTNTDYIAAAIDITLGLIVVIYLSLRGREYFLPFLGALVAAAPDIDNFPLWYRATHNWPVFKQLYGLHNFIHFDLETKYWLVGLLIEIVICGAAIWWLLLK